VISPFIYYSNFYLIYESKLTIIQELYFFINQIDIIGKKYDLNFKLNLKFIIIVIKNIYLTHRNLNKFHQQNPLKIYLLYSKNFNYFL